MKNIPFLEKLMVFACLCLLVIMIVDTVSWFLWRELSGMVRDGLTFFTACAAMYMAKSGYENVHRMKNGHYEDEKGE